MVYRVGLLRDKRILYPRQERLGQRLVRQLVGQIGRFLTEFGRRCENGYQVQQTEGCVCNIYCLGVSNSTANFRLITR